LIIADTQRHAEEAAKLVVVNYADVQTPILTLDDAIAKSSYFPDYPQLNPQPPVKEGDPKSGFQQSGRLLNRYI
jgi:hypothetical protein